MSAKIRIDCYTYDTRQDLSVHLVQPMSIKKSN